MTTRTMRVAFDIIVKAGSDEEARQKIDGFIQEVMAANSKSDAACALPPAGWLCTRQIGQHG